MSDIVPFFVVALAITATFGVIYGLVLLMARRTHQSCSIDGTDLIGLRVRPSPGAPWRGPYYRCDQCGSRFHTEHGELVTSAD